MARIVVALGGNALGNTPAEQREKVAEAAKTLVGLIEQGNEIVVAHGNGPQVGMINLGLSHSAADGVIKAEMPFPECGAMSQGYIGYHLQNAILRRMRERGLPWNVCTVVTQVEVDPDDPAFRNPTKPIGSFYSETEAAARMAAGDGVYKEDAGRGWRKVVPSPIPVDIVEKESVLSLLRDDFVVVACGGGGIPVVKRAEGDYDRGLRRGFPLHPHGRGPRLHQLQQAGSARAEGDDGRRGRKLCRRGTVRPRFDAAQSKGRREIRPVQARPSGRDLLARESDAGHVRRERHDRHRLKTEQQKPHRQKTMRF